MGHVPPRVGVVEHVNYAGFVPNIPRVVEGKKIALVVESQVLRIAQAMGVDLEIRPVRVTTENRSSTGCLVGLAILVHDVKATITHRKVKTSVGSTRDSVKVMPNEGNPDPETIYDFLIRVGHPVVIRIGKPAQGRNTSEVSCVSFGKNGKPNPIESLFECIGKKSPVIGHPIAVPVLQTDQPVRGLGVPSAVSLVRMLVVHGKTVFDRTGLEILPNHFTSSPKVGNAEPKPVGLGNEKPSHRIHVQARGVLHVGITNPSITNVSTMIDLSTERRRLVGQRGHILLGDFQRDGVQRGRNEN